MLGGGGAPAMQPMAAMEVTSQARELARQMEASGVAERGVHRSKLLPSGVVLHYSEFGSESNPPVLLLHDVTECRRVWDAVAAKVAARSYRVLALDLRGHGDTSRHPRRVYELDALLQDVHDLVVDLGLNGRDMDGGYTRPWVLAGRGTCLLYTSPSPRDS